MSVNAPAIEAPEDGLTPAPRPQDFVITESMSVSPSVINDDGTVDIHIIRPGVGRGKGRHLYEAEMLERNAPVFAGWKMYIDHDLPSRRKERGGLPRPTDEIGGRVLESFWDPTVPADENFGQGAVIGRVRPVRKIRELIEDDPGLLEASIAAVATGVKPVTKNGQRAWLVEGIEPRGTVDWVSEAGAGGKIALAEALHDSEEDRAVDTLDCMTDDELKTYVEGRIPGLLEAEQAAITPPAEENEVMDHTDSLREALQSDEMRAMVRDLVEAEVAQERELIRAEAEADADRKLQLRDMRDEAHNTIREAALPVEWTDKLLAEYALVEGRPTAKLDVYDEVDEEGEVVKDALSSLRESLADDLAEQGRLMAALKPTRVEGQGPAKIVEGAEEVPSDKSYWRQHLEGAGVDPDKAYNA